MKRTESLVLADVMQQYFGQEPDLHEHLLEMQAMELLPNILGPIYKYVANASIQDTVLQLQVHSASVKQSLMMQRNLLLRRINEELGIELIREVRIY